MRNKNKLKELSDELIENEEKRKEHYKNNLSVKYLCSHVGKTV